MSVTKLLVAKDEKYARTVAADTVNTALTPDLLAPGSIGIYGIHNSSTNPNRMVLITDGGSEAAGVVPASDFNGTEIIIAIGIEADGNGNSRAQLSNNIPVNGGGDLTIRSTAYAAATRKMLVLNPNFGALAQHDGGTIGIIDVDYIPAAGRQPFSKDRVSMSLGPNVTEYDALTLMVQAFQSKDDLSVKTPTIGSTTAGAALAATATVSAVKGATSLTTSAAHGVGVGDFVRLAGDTYKAVAGTSGTTLVLDRPYAGETATIANGTNVLTQAQDLGTDAGTLTMMIMSASDDFNFDLYYSGIFENSTVTEVTPFFQGKGRGIQVRNAESEHRTAKGSLDAITSYMPLDILRADVSLTYDQYVIQARLNSQPKGSIGSTFDVSNITQMAFVSTVGDTAGENQSDFEDIMTVFFSNLPSLF